MEFKVKTMARAKEICFVLGLIMGEPLQWHFRHKLQFRQTEDKIKVFPA
jgi:hypothetical protein